MDRFGCCFLRNSIPVSRRWLRQGRRMAVRSGMASNSAAKIKLFAGPNTRQWARFDPAELSLAKSIHTNAGYKMEVVNISQGGALLRTRTRLARGQIIRLQLVIAGRLISFKGLILRSLNLYGTEIPRYQAAVVFESPLPIPDSPPRLLNSHVIRAFPSANLNSAVIDVLLEYSACSFYDAAMQEMLRLNSW